MSSKMIHALGCCALTALLSSGCSSNDASAPTGGSAGASGTFAGSAGTSNRGGNDLPEAGASNGGGGTPMAGAANGGAPDTGGGGAGGSAASAGTATGGGGAGGATQGAAGSPTGSFTLSWQDDFDTLDTSRWELESFTYDGNQAEFAPQNASVASGVLSIALSAAAAGSAKPYVGVEMRSSKTLTYGKVSARMRFAKGSGVVSGLVLFYTPFPNCDWNEIDIEHLGNSSNTSQFNAMVFLGAQVPNCTASVTPTQDPLVTNLGFNAESDYHVYDIEWTPTGINYIADGLVLRNWTKNIALLKRPLTVLFTIWASSSASWAGALTPGSAPTSADIDWIKVYDWKG